MTTSKFELMAIDPHCSVCGCELHKATRGAAGAAIDGKLYCQRHRPKTISQSPPIDIMRDPKYLIRSFAELSLWDWHEVCLRLTGFAKSILRTRVRQPMSDTLARTVARETIEATIQGRKQWSASSHPNLLAWLCDQVRADVDVIAPYGGRKRHRQRGSGSGRSRPVEVDLSEVRDLFPESSPMLECVGVG